MKVLVTGAEEHQGLAVIRGLGLAGVPVVACGAANWYTTPPLKSTL